MNTNKQLSDWEEFKEDITSLNDIKNTLNEENDYSNLPLTPLFFHEALDRTYIASKIVEDMLYGHPVYHQHPHLNEKLVKVLELLAEMYQEIPNLPLNNK